MRKTRLLLMVPVLILGSVLGSASATHASATSVDHCTTRYSDELENTSPTGATFIAVPPFKLSCRGGITASLDVMSGGASHTQLQIEKETDGVWLVVARGNYATHRAEPGTYRLTVAQTGKKGSFASWRLRYSKPLP